MLEQSRSEAETVADYGQRVLETTRRFPDAPSAIPMYLRSILEIAVEQERRDTSISYESTESDF